MSEQTSGSDSGPWPLPDAPNLEWLRKQAKRRLEELRAENPSAQLADAQFDLARRYGFSSWRALKRHIDSLGIDGRLFDAAKQGDLATLTSILDEHPDKLFVRSAPYAHTLLHTAAHNGQLAAVELLLARGLDPNVREKGDNTYPMHWAAAAGRVDVVRRLADAGGDVIGHGDDHELEVIGWATCWGEECNDAAHRAVAKHLVSRGARHHIFSAIAMNLADDVRRIVAADPSALNRRMSRNESHQMPLHFAVRMNRPAMVSLLLELGADPLATDGAGHSATMYASGPGVDEPVMEAIRRMTAAELLSAERGLRPSRGGIMDLVAVLSLGDYETAERLVRDNRTLTNGGALHVMAKRNDVRAVRWLLANGADPNARWSHWGAEVTPLHLAAMKRHAEVVRVLLDAGADQTIHDSMHDSDALGWAEYFGHADIVKVLRSHAGST